jgi:hypothetical protein
MAPQGACHWPPAQILRLVNDDAEVDVLEQMYSLAAD